MKELKKVWTAAFVMFAVSCLLALVMYVNGSLKDSVESENRLCWIISAFWMVGAVLFAVDSWWRRELSVIKAMLIVVLFGVALAVLRLLLVTVGFATDLAMHDALSWGSIGLGCAALFAVGAVIELKVAIILVEGDWKHAKFLWMLTLGLVLMAVAMIFVTSFNLLSFEQAVVIAFSAVALVVGMVSCLVVFIWRLVKYFLDLNEIVHALKH